MCTGTALLYKIPRVVVGENRTFSSFAEAVMADNGVDVRVLNDQRCVDMMEDFVRERPDLWCEDIHEVKGQD